MKIKFEVEIIAVPEPHLDGTVVLAHTAQPGNIPLLLLAPATVKVGDKAMVEISY
jgi:hypothetical protein